MRQSAVVDGGRLEPCGSAPALDETPAAGTVEPSAAVSRRSELPKDVKLPSAKAEPVSARTAAVGVGSGESNSDQATCSQAYLPLSPEEPTEGPVHVVVGGATKPHVSRGGQSSLASSAQPSAAPPPQRPRPSAAGTQSASLAAASSSFAATAVTQVRERGPAAVSRSLPARPAESSAPAAPAARNSTQPSASGRQPVPSSPPAGTRLPSGVSVETQTSHRDFPVLPTSFLELPRLSGAALSYNSVGPFDLQLEHDQQRGLVNGSVDAHVEAARRVKREGDQLFQRNGKAWTIKSLSKYVSASLMFMEAAEAYHRSSTRRAADLYQQTANLLGFTINFSDSIKGSNGMGKEALRLLGERLSAICLLRQATLMAVNFRTCADRAQAALRDHQRQQAAQLQGTGGSAVGGPQPSPGDSSTSSLHAAHGGTGSGMGTGALAGSGAGAGGAHGAAHASGSSHGGAAQSLPGFTPEQVTELVSYAKNACLFAESMKRSSKSFEAFLERADVRQDQQAKLVCVHLAAVCMDMGMAGTRVIHHAREAVRTLCEDLAR